jgi:hypothetical protein
VQLSGAKFNDNSRVISFGQKKRGSDFVEEPVSKAGEVQFSRKDQRVFKPWKDNKVKWRFILGSDIGLEDACMMALCTLVGMFSYRKFVQVSIERWVDST